MVINLAHTPQELEVEKKATAELAARVKAAEQRVQEQQRGAPGGCAIKPCTSPGTHSGDQPAVKPHVGGHHKIHYAASAAGWKCIICFLDRVVAPDQQQIRAGEEKLRLLKQGGALVSKAEREKAEEVFTHNMAHWAKRKRVFRELWCAVAAGLLWFVCGISCGHRDAMSENIDCNRGQMLEDMGVETDEAAKCEYARLADLLPTAPKRPRKCG